MEKMKELYQKVSADEGLKRKFTSIIEDTGKVGAAETEKKLISFAKEAGYEVSVEEMSRFFKGMAENKNELSELELDMVAGGKGDVDWGLIGAGAIAAGSIVAGASGAGAGAAVGCVIGAGAVEGATR